MAPPTPLVNRELRPVCGKSETKTVQVIKDAFHVLNGKQLPYLDFTFIGTPEASAEIAPLLAAVGGTYHTREVLDVNFPGADH